MREREAARDGRISNEGGFRVAKAWPRGEDGGEPLKGGRQRRERGWMIGFVATGALLEVSRHM
jgi:hypothetical protein